ncbi:hypothetical protein [Blastopirellula marina]|uniref:Uncharacterized protein n=1 Tax=Blastopirellula marina DSM 3645 TaxID=314230 RepID=A3ZLM7_9BACT|nr:hypothetical protein [Blastopirellula marina]EAQ82660.1 hypothetical protein DSM3645_09682 [Blastopirellula marina DSM 3645]
MPPLIGSPNIIAASDDKPKKNEEFIGRVNSQTSEIRMARTTSPGGGANPH